MRVRPSSELALACLFALGAVWAAPAVEEVAGADVIKATDVRAGLAVHVGTSEGKLVPVRALFEKGDEYQRILRKTGGRDAMKESILADLADPKDRIVNEETLVPPQLRSRVPAPQATAAGTSKSHGP